MNKIELKKPTLILGAGISASGKTTFFKELLPLIYNAFWINKDTLNSSYLKIFRIPVIEIKDYRPLDELPKNSQEYERNIRLQSYHCMLELAKDNLEIGKSILLEGNFTKEIRQGYIENIIPFFKDVDCRIKLLFCYADEETIRKRVLLRNAGRDSDKFSEERWRKLMREQPPLPVELTKYDHVAIDTNKSKEYNLERALEYLSSDSNLLDLK